MSGLKAMYEAGPARPFRFVYLSGFSVERDPTKTPVYRPQYSWMRVSNSAMRPSFVSTLSNHTQGETESQVLAFAAEHKGEVEAAVARPGLIKAPGYIIRNLAATIVGATSTVPNINASEISAALLNQVIEGFDKDTLLNDDLVSLGRQVLESRKGAQTS